MSRYEDAPQEVLDLLDKVRRDWCPELVNARVKVLLDTKKRKSRGNYVLGRIQRANDLIRHLSRDESRSELGYDYILYLDKPVWEKIDPPDRVRLLRHELRHCFYDLEAKGSPYKLLGHDVEDFLIEVDLNKNDPKWRQRLGIIAASVYDEEG